MEKTAQKTIEQLADLLHRKQNEVDRLTNENIQLRFERDNPDTDKRQVLTQADLDRWRNNWVDKEAEKE